MSENSKIEWTDHTFNPWEGCQKVGPGCDNCYAETRNKRFGGGVAVNWGPGAQRRRTSIANWRKPIEWNKAHEAFHAEHGRRQRVFCASLGDVFDNAVDPQWRIDLWNLIEATPNLDWLLLTKRIGNALDMLPVRWAKRRLPHNIWMGATMVNQQERDRDMGKLLDVPASVHFLSVEPLLSALELNLPQGYQGKSQIDWVIVGGESGSGARAMDVSWARAIVQQCKAAGVPVLVKQLGAQPRGWCAAQVHVDPEDREDGACDFYEGHEQRYPCAGRCAALFSKKGSDMAEWPEDLRVRQFPGAAA